MMRRKYGGLINSYRNEVFYWGLLIMIFKLLTVAALSLISDSTSAAATGFIVMVIYYSMFNNLMPYSDEKLSKIEKYSVLCYMTTLFLVIYLRSYGELFVTYTSIGIIIIVNVALVMYMLMDIISAIFNIRRYKKQLKILRGSIAENPLDVSFLSNTDYRNSQIPTRGGQKASEIEEIYDKSNNIIF